VWCLLLAPWLLSTGLASTDETYTLDAAHSKAEFEFTHLGVSTQNGRFDRVSGTVAFDPAHHRGSVHYEIDTNSLNMRTGTEKPDAPGFRFFRVNLFPKIVFQSSELQFDGRGNVIAAEGKLTMLGVSHPVHLSVEHFGCGTSPVNGRHVCAADIHAVIRRSEFGLLDYMGAISDEVLVHIPVEAYRD
jgi:polyisoprenoid-binding protein YceI